MASLDQGTPEWLEMRKEYVGASDAPIIMGVSPFKTPFQLWEEKLSSTEEYTTNPGIERGNQLEPIARQELEKVLGLPLLPKVKYHPSLKWMMASLDAIDFDEKCLAEIKCPGKEDHQTALEGKVPDKYFPQMQHQLEVCELEWGYYYSFDGEKGILIKLYRDDEYIKKLIAKEKEFHERVENFDPPPLTNRDYVEKEGQDWTNAAYYWSHIKKQQERLEKAEKEARERLIELSEGKSCYGAGVRLCKTIRKGNVEYGKIPELKGINLDAYRKPAIEAWRISSL